LPTAIRCTRNSRPPPFDLSAAARHNARMRQLAGYVLVAAVVAAAVYLTVEWTFFDVNGEATPDLSVPSIVLLGLIIAALLAMMLGIAAEVRHLRHRRRAHHF
jgi:hypothetical protein